MRMVYIMCVCVRAGVRACVHMLMCLCVRVVCVCMHVCTHALPRHDRGVT